MGKLFISSGDLFCQKVRNDEKSIKKKCVGRYNIVCDGSRERSSETSNFISMCGIGGLNRLEWLLIEVFLYLTILSFRHTLLNRLQRDMTCNILTTPAPQKVKRPKSAKKMFKWHTSIKVSRARLNSEAFSSDMSDIDGSLGWSKLEHPSRAFSIAMARTTN